VITNRATIYSPTTEAVGVAQACQISHQGERMMSRVFAFAAVLLLGVNSNWPILAIRAAGADVDILSLPILAGKTGTSSSIGTSSSAPISSAVRHSTVKLPNFDIGKSAVIKVCTTGFVVSGGLLLSYNVIQRGLNACIRVLDGIKEYLEERKTNRMEKKKMKDRISKDSDLIDDPLAGYDYSQHDPSYDAHDDLYPEYDPLPEEVDVDARSSKSSSSNFRGEKRGVSNDEKGDPLKSRRPHEVKEDHPHVEKLVKDQEELWRVVHNVFSGHTEKINDLVSSTENDRLLVADKLEKAVSKVERIALNLSTRIEALEAHGDSANESSSGTTDALIEEVRRETKRDLTKVVQTVNNAKLESDRLLKAHEERLIQKLRITVDEVKELIKNSNGSSLKKKKSLK